MSKKLWSRPEALVEEFVAEESVAACYEIACGYAKDLEPSQTGVRDEQEREHTKKPNGSGCGWGDNQSISVVGTGADAVYRIIEINNDTYDRLECRIYPNSTYSGSGSATGKGIEPGQTIYWTTNVGTSFWPIWMRHYGTFELVDAAHPLRS